MKACGVVAEYHPFHYGHLYQLTEARAQSGADVMVVVMSGNWVQRGQYAIVDKWARAETALRHGADIVIELPPTRAVQAAPYFARYAVDALLQCHVEAISFGAEAANKDELVDCATWLVAQEQQLQQEQQSAAFQKQAQSYAKRVTALIAEGAPSASWSQLLHLPNNLLGLMYTKRLVERGVTVDIVPVQRVGAQHQDRAVDVAQFNSGTAIRQLIAQHADRQVLAQVVPEPMAMHLADLPPLVEMSERFWQLLQYQFAVQPTTVLDSIYQMSEGISHRLKRLAIGAHSWAEFLEQAQNKRWTTSRLSRLACYTLLQWPSVQLDALAEPPLRLLGTTAKGRAYFNYLKKADKPVTYATRLSKSSIASSWEIQQLLQADYVYQMITRAPEQNSGRHALVLP